MSDALGPLTQVVGTARTIDTSGDAWVGSSWWQQLQPGSWRGCGFVLDAAETKVGRRVALHEYPYRDTVWPEDLGRLPRRFAFQAWMTGDDVYIQRDAMIAAAEQPGPGTLVHPTLGSIQCVLLDFGVTDRRERGRVVELSFEFIVTGDILYPATTVATGQAVTRLAGALNAASASDFGAALSALPVVPQLATSALPGFLAIAQASVDDPTRALNAVRGLAGYFGRYATGRRSSLLPATATVASVLSGSITQRSAVMAAIALVRTAGAGL